MMKRYVKNVSKTTKGWGFRRMNEEIKILENADDEFGLIEVNQLPVISEQLDKLQEIIQERTQNALQFECTEDNYKEIKTIRSTLTKERTELEKRYKKAMETAIAPIQAVQNKFKNCMGVYKDTDAKLKEKINSVENGIKDIKKQEVIDYFNEYATSKNIDFITFEQLGINVTMSASMKSLKKSVSDTLDRVSCDLKMIETQDDKEAILVEYKKSLNVSEAVQTVKVRMQAIEEEKQKEIERKKAELQKEVAIRQVEEQLDEPLAPPEVIKSAETEIKQQEEQVFTVQFKATATKQKLRQLKEFMKKEGIRYE